MIGLPTSKDKCTGCGACVNICPQKALILDDGNSFFEYPQVNQDLCIDCALCTKTCPSNKDIKSTYPKKAFAVVSKDKNDRDSSATGGASSVLVNSVLEQGGIAYGCEEVDYKTIAHTRIVNLDESYRLKGSKYVQSYIGSTYSQVKDDLNKGVLVIFTGTPCQIAGLKSFLRKDYPNLFLVEIICFGNVAIHFLINHVNYLCTKYSIDNSNVQVYFRQKGDTTADLRYGTFLYRNNKILKAFYSPDDGYHFGFRQGYYLRENCFHCRYSKHERCADITIGDFWGLGVNSKLNEYRNVSVVLLNTEKGIGLFEKAKHKFIIEERPLSEAFKNPHFNSPASKPNDWDDLRKDYSEYGYEYMFNKHIKPAIRRFKIHEITHGFIGLFVLLIKKLRSSILIVLSFVIKRRGDLS